MKRLRTKIKAAFYYIVKRASNNKIKIDVTGIILIPRNRIVPEMGSM